MPPLSVLIWLPAASGLLGAALSLRPWEKRRTERAAPPPRWWSQSSATARPVQKREREERLCGGTALLGTLATLGLAIGYVADFSAGGPSLQHVTDVTWISELQAGTAVDTCRTSTGTNFHSSLHAASMTLCRAASCRNGFENSI